MDNTIVEKLKKYNVNIARILLFLSLSCAILSQVFFTILDFSLPRVTGFIVTGIISRGLKVLFLILAGIVYFKQGLGFKESPIDPSKAMQVLWFTLYTGCLVYIDSLADVVFYFGSGDKPIPWAGTATRVLVIGSWITLFIQLISTASTRYSIMKLLIAYGGAAAAERND